MARHPIAIIVIAQLFGTSLWFSANSAADDLMRQWGASPADIGSLTNATQLGFILGTLTFAGDHGVFSLVNEGSYSEKTLTAIGLLLFTGAIGKKDGRFAKAAGGTVAMGDAIIAKYLALSA